MGSCDFWRHAASTQVKGKVKFAVVERERVLRYLPSGRREGIVPAGYRLPASDTFVFYESLADSIEDGLGAVVDVKLFVDARYVVADGLL